MQDFTLNSTVRIQKSWLLGSRTVELVATLTPSLGKQSELFVGELLEQLLHFVAPLKSLEEQLQDHPDGQLPPIVDLRGRPGESFTPTVQIPRSRQNVHREELAYVRGRLIEPAEPLDETPSSSDSAPQSHPFSFQVLSQFRAFEGSRHIVHDVLTYREGALQTFFPQASLESLSRLVPAKVDAARFGFEVYKAQYFGSWIGQTPKIDSRLYCELTPEKVTFSLVGDGPLKSSTFPEVLDQWIKEIHAALSQVDQNINFRSAADEALAKSA